MTDERDQSVARRLAELGERTGGVVPSAALSARLRAIPVAPEGLLPALSRLTFPALAVAGLAAVGLYVADATGAGSFEDDVASAAVEVGP